MPPFEGIRFSRPADSTTPAKPKIVSATPVSQAGVTRSRSYCLGALRDESNKVRATVQGSRSDTRFEAAMKMKKYIGQLMETEIVNELTAAALHVGLPEGKISRTIQNGFKCGRGGATTYILLNQSAVPSVTNVSNVETVDSVPEIPEGISGDKGDRRDSWDSSDSYDKIDDKSPKSQCLNTAPPEQLPESKPDKGLEAATEVRSNEDRIKEASCREFGIYGWVDPRKVAHELNLPLEEVTAWLESNYVASNREDGSIGYRQRPLAVVAVAAATA